MSECFMFQIEFCSLVDPTTVRVEGRCCEGSVQAGDTFTEFVSRDRDEHGAIRTIGTQTVEIKLQNVTSIRPGFLGIAETGTLILDISANADILRAAFLSGVRNEIRGVRGARSKKGQTPCKE